MTDFPTEHRFQEPQGWQWGQFKNAGGQIIRFGQAVPPSGKPDAAIILLPGRTEYAEKYFETAHDLLAQNYSVYVIDWAGQGASGRFDIPHPDRGYAPDFDEYVSDLHTFITAHVKTAAPLVMLAHSMGGNIGLRYLAEHPRVFNCAAFSAPMLGIYPLRAIPLPVTKPLLWTLKTFAGPAYAFGEKDWSPENRAKDGGRFSSDPDRGALHNAWMSANPQLQLGGVTYKWLYESIKSCEILQKPDVIQAIRTPNLIILAGKETFVDNTATRALARRLPDCKLKEIPGSGHEILMESDEIRGEFLAHFYTLIHENIV